MLGTASRARRWLLLEQPGAWGADALLQSSLPFEVAERLRALGRSLPCRVLLLRRPGGRKDADGACTLFAGISRVGGGGWFEEVALDGPADLLDLDLRPLATGASVGGARVEDPLYLVCTNGSHDPCCAEYGLPVVRALAEVVPGRVWECSHIGGDRFAANLACLPEGLFYGRLDPQTAVAAVTAHEAGRLVLSHLRGRSSLAFPVQAAEVLVRGEIDAAGFADLRVVRHERPEPERHRVVFALADGREAVATVRCDDGGDRALTCAGGQGRPPRFALEHLDLH